MPETNILRADIADELNVRPHSICGRFRYSVNDPMRDGSMRVLH